MATKQTLSLERLMTLVSYDPRTGIFKRLVSVPFAPAGSECRCRNKAGYVVFRIDGRLYTAHRLAWFYTHGKWPEVIDHINGDPADNRISNLRAVTQTENMWNLRKVRHNTSGLVGVSRLRNGKWRAQIVVGGQHHSLGWHATKEEAHKAYVQAAMELRGFVGYGTGAV